MLVAQDFRDRARAALSGNWGVAVGTGFVASWLGAYTAFDSGSSSSSNNVSEEDLAVFESMGSEELRVFLSVFLVIMAVIIGVALIFAIVTFIIGGPITLGYVKFNLDMVDGKKPEFGDLFSQFHRFGDAFLMQLMRNIFVFLWSLLLIIPGIIAGYSYAMAPYILYENPHMSGMEAIAESKKLMDGNKWRLFCLGFSFIGWSILTVFTCGIGMLWLYPYREAACAAFYQEIKREKYGSSTYNTNSFGNYEFGNPYEQTENPYENTANPFEQ